MKNICEAMWFANGRHDVNLKRPNMKVRAVRRAEHGDWKTQLVREDFMGMEQGQEGELVEVWDNFEGRWCRVKFNERHADISQNDLEIIRVNP